MFKLADQLGGRSEVVNSPISELLKYMELSIEKDKNEQMQKKAEMYINYLTQVFSQQLQEKPSSEYTKAKENFLDMLNPQSEEDKKDKKSEMKWDYDPEKYAHLTKEIE